MPIISGPISLVTGQPAVVSSVAVRSAKLRPLLGGLLTTGNDYVPVVDGRVTVEVVSGPAVMTLLSSDGPVETVKLLVSESTSSLEDAVKAALVADEADASQLDALIEEMGSLLGEVKAAAKSANDAALRTENALDTKANKEHTHTMGQVTGLTEELAAKAAADHEHSLAEIGGVPDSHSASAIGGSLASRDAAGRLAVSDPDGEMDAANKKYVDATVATRAERSHSHTSEQISDAVSVTGGAVQAGKVVKAGGAGHVQSSANPVAANDLSRKAYVDAEVLRVQTTFKPNTVTVETEAQAQALTGLRKGDVVVVVQTGNIYKEV